MRLPLLTRSLSIDAEPAAIECPESKLSGSRLFETVAVNRSAQVRIGFKEEELLAWLRAD